MVPNLDNSLAAWWRMDDVNESGDVVDYIGDNNGTLIADSEILALYNATRISFNETLSEGAHNYTAYASDVSANVNSSSVSFSVDATAPSIDIVSPTNISYSSSSVLFNVSSSDEGVGFIVPNLDGSLVSWWRMDDVNGSGDVVDYTGKYNGSLVGTAAINDSNGKFGDGAWFDGDSDYIQQDVDYQVTLPVTISAWVKKRDASGHRVYSSDSFTAAGNYYGVVVGVGSTGVAYTHYGDGGSPGPASRMGKTGATVLENDVWYHITWIIRGNNDINISINGLDDGGAFTGTGGDIVNTGDAPRIGNSYGTGYMNGSIDEVMIFNKSLDESEVLALYNATRISFIENVSDGNYNYTAYASDLAANVNSSSVSFSVDLADSRKVGVDILYPTTLS